MGVPFDAALQAPRDWWLAMKRGMRLRCPHCGEGKMFRSYLKPFDACENCGEELHHHRADDAPPYVTIVIVGHIVVGLLMIVDQKYPELSMWVHMAMWTTLSVVLSLIMLPSIKGALIGLQWALKMHGFRDRHAGPASGANVTRIIDRTTDLTTVLNEEIWSRLQRQKPTGVRPRLASTLILIDRTGPEPKVLMGRRNPASKFMPGKFVFPGGRVEPGDRRMNAAGALPGPVEERLARVDPKSHSLPRALALGAIRETFEETGIVLGAADMGAPDTAPAGEWQKFAAQGLYPLIDNIHFIARATTPPRQTRRFDTIFLAAEASDIATTIDGAVGPDRELVELTWVPLSRAHDLELPLITSVVLHELDRRITAGMGHHLPTPWYRVGGKGWLRTEL